MGLRRLPRPRVPGAVARPVRRPRPGPGAEPHRHPRPRGGPRLHRPGPHRPDVAGHRHRHRLGHDPPDGGRHDPPHPPPPHPRPPSRRRPGPRHRRLAVTGGRPRPSGVRDAAARGLIPAGVHVRDSGTASPALHVTPTPWTAFPASLA
ncbi:DUF397 domain-containing protein [Streptomyces galbus]|uniref:DUF397 domain-containing protein n=1 Tax=Streptomyces galbus TaxID=33898 RepID=A0A4V6AXC6_STRGB|nr:DUF397 domain-containing protein [Streptomyces galbus]